MNPRLFLAVALLLLVWSGVASAEDAAVPTAVQGTGVNVFVWLFREFGWPGLIGWLCWRLPQIAGKFPGIPVSVAPIEHVHRFHPETAEQVNAMVRQATDHVELSDSGEPVAELARPRPVSHTPQRRQR